MSVRNIDVGNYQTGASGIEPSTTSHHSLTDLTDYDDHPQYWHIPSRSTDVLTISNTTDSSSISTGALVVAGGAGITGNINGVNLALSGTLTSTGSINGSNMLLSGTLGISGAISSSSSITAYGTISSPTISSTGTISSAHMICTNAPANSTDVVRLSDLSSYQAPVHITIAGNWTNVSESQTMSATLHLVVMGSMVFLYQSSTYNMTVNNNDSLLFEPTTPIPSQYLPFTDWYWQIQVQMTGLTNVILRTQISSTIDPIMITPMNTVFSAGSVSILPWMVSWSTS